MIEDERWYQRWCQTAVEKTTIYLSLELKTAIKRVAQRRGVSEAEVIRDSIRSAIGEDRPRPRGALFCERSPHRTPRRRPSHGLRRAVIVDTSALLAFFDVDEPDHDAVAAVLVDADEPLVVSPYVVAELDYLVGSRLGIAAELAVIAELAGGAWDLPAIDAEGLKDARTVVERYPDQRIGVADASNVVLAEHYQTQTIVTLDHRHFDVLHPLTGGRFTVLP
jgi:predicted nucleic acid-binding protein